MLKKSSVIRPVWGLDWSTKHAVELSVVEVAERSGKHRRGTGRQVHWFAVGSDLA